MGLRNMADSNNTSIYVFTKEAVLRSIVRLEEHPIHEHFSGYLAILRARQGNQGLPVHLSDIAEFHDRYLRVVGASDKAPYVSMRVNTGRLREAPLLHRAFAVIQNRFRTRDSV